MTKVFSVSSGVLLSVVSPIRLEMRKTCVSTAIVVNDRSDDVGCFPSDTGQFLKLVDIGRHDAMENIGQHFGHSHQMLCLVMGIRDTFDIFIYHFGGRGGQGFRSGKSFVQGGSDLVHPLVCTLCGEDYSNQQFIRIPVMELGFCNRDIGLKPIDNTFVSVFSPHAFHIANKNGKHLFFTSVFTPDLG